MLGQETVRNDFEEQLGGYVASIDSRLKDAADSMFAEAGLYGEDAVASIDAYTAVLTRGGKRFRGVLAMAGYEMMCGRNQDVALDAACAVEMIHAHLLVLDDIQDGSTLRRGGLPAHKILERRGEDENWLGDRSRKGEFFATNASLVAEKNAEKIIRNMPVTADTRMRVLDVLGDSMIVTGYGQTMDVSSQARGTATQQEVRQAMDLKTGRYSICFPLQIGMVLGGATDSNLKLVEPFAMHLGRAYQLKDDLLPYIVGESDKDPSSDLREGKVNLVVLDAREHLSPRDRGYFNRHLGKVDLLDDEFRRCRDLVIRAGTVARLMIEARSSADKAVSEIEKFPGHFNQNTIRFLGQLAGYAIEHGTETV